MPEFIPHAGRDPSDVVGDVDRSWRRDVSDALLRADGNASALEVAEAWQAALLWLFETLTADVRRISPKIGGPVLRPGGVFQLARRNLAWAIATRTGHRRGRVALIDLYAVEAAHDGYVRPKPLAGSYALAEHDIAHLLDRLTDRQREAFVLVGMRDFETADAAEVMGLTKTQAKTAWRESRKRLLQLHNRDLALA